ncbi:MAG TPA: DUF4331 family protein [Myxococcales bacterium]
MHKRRYRRAAAVVAALLAPVALAADHTDGPQATADPAADITDVFAWTSSDGTKLNLIMNVFPAATAAAKFSNAVQYVLHTQSHPGFGQAAAATEDIVCTFDTSQRVSCWAGTEYVNGDASSTSGIASGDGKLRVFTGLRDDPFFFNLDGFKHAVATVKGAAASLTFDPAGCPKLDAATSAALVNQLKTDQNGNAPQDHFKGLNVLAIVVQVDLAIVNKGGPVVSVWASTNK